MITKKTLKNYLLPLIGVVILIIFIKNIPSELLSVSLREIGLINIIILLSLTALNLFLKAVRWRLLVFKIASAKISLKFSFSTILAGIAGSSIMPGRVELTRPLMLKTEYDVPLSRSVSALSIERVMDLVSLLVIMTLGILFLSTSISISFILPALAAVILVLAFFFLITIFTPHWITLIEKILFIFVRKENSREKIRQFLISFFEGLSRLEKRYVTGMTLFSIAINGIEIIRFYFLLQMTGLGVSLAAVGFAFTASILIGVVTMIPGGIGVTELSAAEIITSLIPSLPKGLVTSSVLLDRVIAYYLLVAAGALILTFYGRYSKTGKEAQKMQ